METSTISITLWGNGIIKGDWLEWYNYVETIFQDLGYKKTHIGIQSKSYTNGKVMSVLRKEKEIIKKLKEGEEPVSLSCYSMPDNYKTVSFDYNVLVVRQRRYISLIFNLSDYEKINLEKVILDLKKYIEFESGQIYQMDRMEMPLIYAAKANPIKDFKTLTVLKEI